MRTGAAHRLPRRGRPVVVAVVAAAIVGSLSIRVAAAAASVPRGVEEAPSSVTAGAREPAILRFVATPARLPRRGGRVAIVAEVRNARFCELSAHGGVVVLPRGSDCGVRATTIAVAANRSTSERTIHLVLSASGPDGTRRAAATVRVAPAVGVAPAVTREPVSKRAPPGMVVQLSAAASGAPLPHVRWQRSGDAGLDWKAVADASAPTYAFVAAARNSGAEYRAVFSNAVGSVRTRPAVVTVSPGAAGALGPTITSEPASETVEPGEPATFSASATGTPAPSVQWEMSSNAGASWEEIVGATSSEYEMSAESDDNGDELRAVFTSDNGSATTVAAQLSVGERTYNWAGYVEAGSSVTSASGTWTVPRVTCGPTSTLMSQWVGVDGFASETVEQVGVAIDCQGGVASYEAWYEMVGDAAEDNGYQVTLPASDVVRPGDVVSGLVGESGRSWTLVLSDETEGWSFTYVPQLSAGFSPALSSAEWVVERPDACGSTCQYSELADFGATSFSDAAATVAGVTGPIDASASDSELSMINRSPADDLAQTSVLDPAGDSFTVTWLASGTLQPVQP